MAECSTDFNTSLKFTSKSTALILVILCVFSIINHSVKSDFFKNHVQCYLDIMPTSGIWVFCSIITHTCSIFPHFLASSNLKYDIKKFFHEDILHRDIVKCHNPQRAHLYPLRDVGSQYENNKANASRDIVRKLNLSSTQWMCVCNMRAIRLTVSEISSGNVTQTHSRTARHGDANIPRPYFVGGG